MRREAPHRILYRYNDVAESVYTIDNDVINVVVALCTVDASDDGHIGCGR